MRLVRLSALCAAVGLALLGQAPAQAVDVEAVQILQAGAQEGVSLGYPGVAGMVRDGADTAYVGAGKNSASAAGAIQPQAKFRIGSNTKTFVATVLLQLEAEGALDLDDTVGQWLPGAVDLNGYDGGLISVRQLLNHTSGLPEYSDTPQVSVPYLANLNNTQAWPPQTLVDIAQNRQAPTVAPGTKFEYRNTNYVLAGMVIKAVTGNEAATEVQNRILTPLGLTDTSFPTSDPNIPGAHIKGHSFPLVGPFIFDRTFTNVQVYGAAGAMISTQEDLADFTRALLSGQLLPPAQLAAMKTTVPTGSAGYGYGLGILRTDLPCGVTAWGHNGAVLGYFATWLATEDGSKQVSHVNNEFHLIGGTPGQQATGTALNASFCALAS